MTDAERGVWFHERLEAEQLRLGLRMPQHPDDPTHDTAVGAAIRTVFAGCVAEGLAGYNAWAAEAGYEPARLAGDTDCETLIALAPAPGWLLRLTPDGFVLVG